MILLIFDTRQFTLKINVVMFLFPSTGECKQFMTKYMRCLRENQLENTKCRKASMDYLNCRMEK